MIFRASAGLFFMGLLLSVAMLQMAEALIYPGTVQLIPSGNLQMSANWIDTPKNGTWYNVLLLTNFVGMTASTHIKRDFTYEGTTAKIEIGDFNSHEWVPANNATIATQKCQSLLIQWCRHTRRQALRHVGCKTTKMVVFVRAVSLHLCHTLFACIGIRFLLQRGDLKTLRPPLCIRSRTIV